MPIFSDLVVLELSSVLAGPAVGAFFAELGATVIKLEPPVGDVTRTWRVAGEGGGDDRSAYYTSVNWGKQCICLNLKKPLGLQALYDLVPRVDVVVSNYKIGDDARLGVDYDKLRQRRPDLIYAHITGYGYDNPRAGYDAVVQAEAGFMHLNGEPDNLPTKMPVALMDLMAAHQLKQAILVALLQRERTGQGSQVAVSLLHAGLAALANQAAAWLVAGHEPQRMGSEHPAIAPYGTLFLTQDQQYVLLAVGNDRQFAELCVVLAVPQLVTDARFATNPARVQHRSALLPLLQAAIAHWQRDALLAALHARDIPAGAVHTIPQACALPAAQDLLLTDADSTLRGMRHIAFEAPAGWQQLQLDAPQHLGQQTEAVLARYAGYDAAHLAALRAAQVIY